MGTLTSVPPHTRHPVTFDEDIGAVRRALSRLVAETPDVKQGDAELVATELATNIVRHAPGGGYMLVRPVGDGVELLAVDRGARGSFQSTTQAVSAWSLAATRGLGAGLAIVARLSTSFDCYSATGGTVVLSRLGVNEAFDAGWCGWGGVNTARAGEAESGDAWTVAAVTTSAVAALLVDGLGHGPEAAVAAEAAIASFQGRPTTDLETLVYRAHEAMRPTRGGVLGAAIIDSDRGEVSFAGIGNITACVVANGKNQYLPSRDGVLGGQVPVPHAKAVQAPWGSNATLVLASDGIHAHWDLEAYPGLLGHDPAVVAAVVQRDYERGSDDAAVVVVQDLRGRR